MTILYSSWFIPAVIVIIIVGLYLLSYREQEVSDVDESPEERLWLVQCPKCDRWKKLKPIESNYQDALPSTQKPVFYPGAQYHYVNMYKCAFCGHRWREKYLE